jgi:hypothetical protein
MTGLHQTSPRWHRFAEEVVSIVIGILVAFQLEPYLGTRLDLETLASDPGGTGARRPIDQVVADDTFGRLLYLNRERTQESLGFGARLLATVFGVQRVLGEIE